MRSTAAINLDALVFEYVQRWIRNKLSDTEIIDGDLKKKKWINKKKKSPANVAETPPATNSSSCAMAALGVAGVAGVAADDDAPGGHQLQPAGAASTSSVVFRGRPTTVHPVVAPPYRKSVVFRPSELTKDITITQRKVGIHRISGTFNPHFSKCVHFIPNLFQPSDQFHHVALAGFWANFFFFTLNCAAAWK